MHAEPPHGPVAAYRRAWLPELVTLAVLSLVTALLFGVTDLDIVLMHGFYRPHLANPWPAASRQPWLLLYWSAPWVTASLALAGMALLVTGLVRRRLRRWRTHGLFILVTVAVGPGLIINAILKDHWGRPRPRQIVECGGRLDYVAPLLPADTHGKSFPCGHCSVGFLYGLGWWLWRRRRPLRAIGSLAVGLALGTLLGLGRMAAGGHFPSDIVWSGLIAYGVAHALYYYVLRIPAREDRRAVVYPRLERNPGLRRATVAAAVLLGSGIVFGGLLATPHYRDLADQVRLAELPARPESVEVWVDTLDVEVELTDEPRTEIECAGSIHGFGLPTNRSRATWEVADAPAATLRYRVTLTGWFTDIDGIARIRLPCQNLLRVFVRAERGDIRIVDATGGRIAPGDLPVLDVRSGDGEVQVPARWVEAGRVR
jgi:lipid A 4'-phosphatase